MKKFYKWYKSNKLYINRSFLFLAGVIIVFYILPNQGRFGKDFEKNGIWKHEDYMAPFSFPIFKTDAQLKIEEDSILSEFNPYYEYDTSKYNQHKERLTKALLNYLSESTLNTRTDTLFSKYILTPLNFIYKKGILDRTDLLEMNNQNQDIYINVVKNNISEQFAIFDLFTQKKAYEYIVNSKIELNNLSVLRRMPEFKKFLNEYNFNEHIVPNLIYNAEKTEKAKFELIKNISIYEGAEFNKGKRIISKGEVVDTRTFQILNSLKRKYESWILQSSNYFLIFLGQFIFIFISFLVLFLFLYHFRFEVLEDFKKSVFVVFISTLFVVVSSLIIRFGPIPYYIIPFAILPIVIRTFYDDRLALFVHMLTIFMVGYIVPNPFEFIFLNFITGIIAIFSLNNLYRRRRLVITSLLIILSYSVVYSGLEIVSTGILSEIDANHFLWFAINGLFIFLIYPIIWVFEKMFGFLSDVTLMELSDTNQDLLRKLAEVAPGTFQHSLQVANLAEEAIYHIGGNSLLVRTGALYHDIGKMVNPEYFTENQKNNINPHDNHPYEESAKIIIGHVTSGIEIAKKNKLPQPVIDFIRTHHGTSTVRYFYRLSVNEAKENGKEVDINKFRYPGPIPYSKETAVLMMADSIEAASRSLTDITEETLQRLVDSIIDYQLAEDQFMNADITFKDISTIKNVFMKKLTNIYHVRIQYPE